MKDIYWLLAGAAIILAGCDGREPAVSQVQTAQSVQGETAETGGAIVAGTSEADTDAATPGIVSEETAGSAATEVVESAADALESANSKGVGESLAAAMGTAGAVGAMLEGEAPAEAIETTGAGVAETTATAQQAAVDIDLALGEKVYTSHCVACHATGATGAPKLGDASWTQRVAQGMDVMAANALNGFRGTSGYMPPKGGFGGLADEEVIAAVAYMAESVR